MDLSTIIGSTFLGATLLLLSAGIIFGGYRVAGAVVFWTTHLLILVWALQADRPLSTLGGLLLGWAAAAVLLGLVGAGRHAPERPTFPPTRAATPLPPPEAEHRHLHLVGPAQAWQGTGSVVKR